MKPTRNNPYRWCNHNALCRANDTPPSGSPGHRFDKRAAHRFDRRVARRTLSNRSNAV